MGFSDPSPAERGEGLIKPMEDPNWTDLFCQLISKWPPVNRLLLLVAAKILFLVLSLLRRLGRNRVNFFMFQ